MREVRTHVFRGRRYRFKVHWIDKKKRLYGVCDAPCQEAKRLILKPNLRGCSKLDTTIHEGLHASLWELSELAVTEAATDAARLLWRMGWRFLGTGVEPEPLENIRRHRFRAHFWMIRFVPQVRFRKRRDSVGRILWLSYYKGTKRELESNLRQCFYISLPDIDTDPLDEAAHDITSFLWRLGWRRKDQLTPSATVVE